MAINKKLIFWKSATFNPPTSSTDTTKDVLWSSIVFFDSTAGTYANSIWTHGQVFSAGTWGTNQTNYVPLTLSGTTYNLSKDGHTHSYLPLSGGTMTGELKVTLDGRAASFGVNATTPNSTIANQTNYIQIVANGATESMGLVFHNSTVSTSALEYVNTDVNTGYFNFKSDDTTWNARINNNVIWHAGNDGAGTGLDADLLDGYHASSSATANTIALRDSNGYLYVAGLNSTLADTTTAATHYYVETGSDGLLRPKTLADVKTEIVTKAAVEASLTGAITSHTHSYLPLSGGTLSGPLYVTTLAGLNYSGIGTNYNIAPGVSNVSSTPVAGFLWHDLFAFAKIYTTTFETSADGITYTPATLNKNLFAQKEAQSIPILNYLTTKSVRWKFTNVAWGYGAWLILGFAYVNGTVDKTITVETSTDNTNWTSRHTSTGTWNAQPAWFYITPYGGDAYMRITITYNSGNQNVNLASMRLLTSRWGDQGAGSEYSYPYTWDADQNITAGGTITASTFYGNLSGTATSATSATSAGKWTSARTVTFGTGDISGSFTIDGSADVSNVNLQVADNSHNHTSLTGVTSLTFAAPSGDPSPTITSRVVPTTQGGASEKSELILFHSNDGANGAGVDQITLRAPGLSFQTYTDSGVSTISADAGYNERLYIAPNGAVTISQTLAVTNGITANLTGNALTATTWQSARTLTIGASGKSVNGAGDVSWSLAEIGAAESVHTHNYLPLIGGNLTGAITISNQAAINTTTPGTQLYGLHFLGQSTSDYATGITWNGGNTGAQAGIYVQGSGSYGTKMYIATTDAYVSGSKTAISIDHTGLVNFERVRPKALGNLILDVGNYSSYALPLGGGTLTGQLEISNDAPQMKFSDTTSGAHDFWIHVNSDTFYILTDRNNDGNWDGNHPAAFVNSDASLYIYGDKALDTGNYSTYALPIDGGTMTGSLNFKNGTWNNVGDDVAIGDVNVAGRLGIKALNSAIPGLVFYNSSSVDVGHLTSNAGTLQWGGYTIWHSNNDGSGSGLDADLLDGYQSTAFLRPYHSNSDFVNGTLVQTNIPSNTTDGASFILEATGKSYSGTYPPFSFIIQGYLYNNTIINYSGSHITGYGFDQAKILDNGGTLAFWWPRVSYWNSFQVIVRDAGDTGTVANRVTTITDSAEPASSKKVTVTMVKNISSANYTGYAFPPASHAHGNISNGGAIGSNANLPLITTTGGVITTGTFGTAANTFCQGNDSRLSDSRPASTIGGSTWAPASNIFLGQTANNQEWSFDITRNGYTGGYWHVWDSANSTMLKVDAVTGKVSAPYNFVGNLEGNASGLSSVIAENRLVQRLYSYTSQYPVNPNDFKKNGFAYSATVAQLPPNVDDANILGIFYADGGWGHQLAFKFNGNGVGGAGYDGKDLYTRTYNQSTSTWTAWYNLLSSGNYSSYSPKLDGTGATGTWNIRVTGFANAGSPKLYSTDAPYAYDSANPYYGYLTYNASANRWRFKVSPATPDAVEVAYADTAGTASSSPKLSASAALTTQGGDGTVIYGYALTNPQTGLFSAVDNSNAILTINRHPGNYYSQLGFSSNGNMYYRSFSAAAIDTTKTWNVIWTDGNHGSGSGLNADLLDGYHADTAASANTVVRRDSNGYIYGVYINSNRGNETSTAASYIYDTGDGWMRKKTLANTQTEIVTKAAVESALSSGGSITGTLNTEAGLNIYGTYSIAWKANAGTAAHAWINAAANSDLQFYADSSTTPTMTISSTAVTAVSFIGALTGNASTATTFSTNRTNYKGVTDGAVAGQLMWKNYGNNHTIFDASAATSPSGETINRYTPNYRITNNEAQQSWGEAPVLMGWNGSNTYGVKVDYAARAYTADSASSAGSISGWNNPPTNNNGGTWPHLVGVKSDGVAEIGQYLDFHGSSAEGSDYAIRLTNSSGTLLIGSNTAIHSGNYNNYTSRTRTSYYLAAGAGWYRVANTTGGSHGAMIITLYGYTGGMHAAAKFIVTSHHGQSAITQIAGDSYSGSEFTSVRTAYNTANRVYGGHAFEVYYSGAYTIYYSIEDVNVSNMYNEWIFGFAASDSTYTADKTLANVTTYALQSTDHPYSLSGHTHNYAGSSSAGGAANSVAASLTFNSGGAGAASGTTFNGSTAQTISYNTIGAAALSHTHSYLPLSGGVLTGNIEVTYNSGVTGSTAPSYSQTNVQLVTSSNNVPAIGFHRSGTSATTLYEYNGELYVNAWTTRSQTGKLLSSGNYNSYAPTLTGTGATGTWAINVSGKAATLNVYASNEVVLGDGFTGGRLYVNYRGSTSAITEYYMCNGLGSTLTQVTASGFAKSGSSNSYALLGGGSHKPLYEFMTDAGGSYSGLIYNLQPRTMFSGYNLTDAPTTGWVSGIVLADQWNPSHYQRYIVVAGNNMYYGNNANPPTWFTMLHSTNYSNYVVPKTGGTMTGNLTISNTQPILLLTDTNLLTAALVTEVDGQLIDFGTNFSQSGVRNVSYRGGYFRIDTRDSNPTEFFSVHHIPANGSDATIFKVSNAGAVVASSTITATAFYESSDLRLKTNIESIDDKTTDLIFSEDFLKSFTRKDRGYQDYGVIAQHIETYFPDLVSTSDTGFKHVKYSAVLSMIMGASIKKIKSLEERIIQLENK